MKLSLDAGIKVCPDHSAGFRHLHPAVIFLQQLHVAVTATHGHVGKFRRDPYILRFGSLHQ